MKRLERLAKLGFAVVMAVLCWRPGRRRAARSALAVARPRRVLVVRLDNRVGEALLTTPLLDALKAAGHEVHLLTHPKMRRVLEGHGALARLWSWERPLGTLRALRAQRFEAVINCGNWAEPAVTSAVVARLAGPAGVVLGPANFPSGWLMDVPVPPREGTTSEFVQRAQLGAALAPLPAPLRLSFRPTPPFVVVPGRYAVVNPGGRLGWRRVPTATFGLAARALAARGVTPVVTWGPGEGPLADEVCAACPQAVRAPATDLEQLASLVRACGLTLCNNTGPMHLAVAVGCPTVALFLRMDVARWGHDYAPHQMVDLSQTDDVEGAVTRALAALRLSSAAAPG